MAKDSRDSLSYYHILHVCGEEGRWQLALQLCDELRAHLGEEAFHSGHYLACMRACARDRRWAESVALARAMPSATLANDNWLLKEALGRLRGGRARHGRDDRFIDGRPCQD